VLFESAKGTAASRQRGKELASPFGGALATVTVLRVLFERKTNVLIVSEKLTGIAPLSCSHLVAGRRLSPGRNNTSGSSRRWYSSWIF
jgi:hypothetical protein